MATKKTDESSPKPVAARKSTPTPAPQVQTNNSASIPIIAMILGIVSLVTFTWFLGIPAIVLGIIGLKKYEENRGFSITGLITGIISTVLMLLATLFVIVLIIIGIASDTPEIIDYSPRDNGSQREDPSDRDRQYRDSLENI